MAFAAPRSLKEPIGCRFSSLSQISPGASRFRRRSGVRTVTPARRSRAARISSSVGDSRVRTSEGKSHSSPLLQGFMVDVTGGGQVLDREAERLEKGDLGGGAAPFDFSDQQIADLPDDVVLGD